MLRSLVLVAVLVGSANARNRTVVITGATGRSGSYTYLLLKQQGLNVRGLVRDVSKARQYLNCSKCDESEGIFVGDITKKESLMSAMAGADSLIIATGRSGGEQPEDILFTGVMNQVDAFLSSPGPAPQDRHVMQVSMMETTLLDTIMNKIIARFWGGWSVGFYSLQGEAALMDANVPFTIIKCCGLDDAPAAQKQLLVGHYDQGWSAWGIKPGQDSVSRHDVARLLAVAAQNPKMTSGLRFDLCAKAGTPQIDEMQVLKEAMFSFDPRKNSTRDGAVVI